MGRRGIRDLKTRVGRGSCISTGGADRPSGTVEYTSWRSPRGIHSVGRSEIFSRTRDAAVRTAPGVRAA